MTSLFRATVTYFEFTATGLGHTELHATQVAIAKACDEAAENALKYEGDAMVVDASTFSSMGAVNIWAFDMEEVDVSVEKIR